MKNILFISWGLLGDTLCTTPVISALKKRYPDSSITVITKPYTKDIFLYNPYVNRVLILEKKVHSLDRIKESSISMLDLMRYIWKSGPYDICVDFYGNYRSLLLSLVSRSRQRICVYRESRKFYNIFFTHLLRPSQDIMDKFGMMCHVKEFFDMFGISYDDLLPEIYYDSKAEEKAERIIVNSDKYQIGIFVGASWEAKKWPLDYIHKVVVELNHKIQFYIIYGPLETDEFRSYCNKLFNNLAPIIDNLNLPEFTAFVNKMDILISNDTFSLHVAKALKKKCIALFGPNSPEPVKLNPAYSVILSGYNKCPNNHRCKKCNTYECIKSISPEEVIDSINNLLHINTKS